jgi:hypothetical protein
MRLIFLLTNAGLAACVVCSVAAAAPPAYRIEKPRVGSVEGDLSFVETGGFPAYKSVSIDILRAGKTVYSRAAPNQLVPLGVRGICGD